MSDQWNDFLLRKNLSDTGVYPCTQGGWTNSPDLIPTGTSIIQDPNTAFGGANYSKDLGQPTQAFQQNYFYMRSKNLASGANSGNLYLYYCPQNLFLFPSLWVNNQLKSINGNSNIPIVAANSGDIAVTSEPFLFTPTSDIHSCLIGRVTTTQNPNPLPVDGTIQTMDDLAAYICDHPDMAWRNVDLRDYNVPTFTNTFTIDTTAIPANATGQCWVGISFNNLTPGSQVSFSASSAIPSGPNQGTLLQLVKTPVTQPNGSVGTSIVTLPGGWKTTITYSYWAQTPILANWSISFYAILMQQPGQSLKLAKHLRPLHELGVAGLNHSHPMLKMLNEMTMGVVLGSVTSKAVGN